MAVHGVERADLHLFSADRTARESAGAIWLDEYRRGVSPLDWDSTKRKLAEAAEIGRDAAVTKSLKAGGRAALDATAERTAQVMAAAQALLASDLSSDLNNLVAAAIKGSAKPTKMKGSTL